MYVRHLTGAPTKKLMTPRSLKNKHRVEQAVRMKCTTVLSLFIYTSNCKISEKKLMKYILCPNLLLSRKV